LVNIQPHFLKVTNLNTETHNIIEDTRKNAELRAENFSEEVSQADVTKYREEDNDPKIYNRNLMPVEYRVRTANHQSEQNNKIPLEPKKFNSKTNEIIFCDVLTKTCFIVSR
jgi:hypothetical protein